LKPFTGHGNAKIARSRRAIFVFADAAVRRGQKNIGEAFPTL
jgi:hypothetical protein